MTKSDSNLCNVPPAGLHASANNTGQRLVKRRAPLLRLLAFSMVLLLLTVRFGSFSEEAFVTPVEDAFFDIACISATDHNLPAKVIKSKRALDCDLPLGGVPEATPILVFAFLPAYDPAFFFDEIPCEIFIPPEGLSWSLNRA